MITCPACGAAIQEETAVTCPSCGAALSAGGSRFARRSRVSRPERPERPARAPRPVSEPAAPAAETPAPAPAPVQEPVQQPVQPAEPAAPVAETPAPAASGARRFGRDRAARAAAPETPAPETPAPEAAPAPAPQPAADQPSLASTGKPARILETPEEKEKRGQEKKKAVLVAVVIVLAVILIYGIITLVGVLADKKNEKPASSPSNAVSQSGESAESAGDDFDWGEATAEEPVQEQTSSAVPGENQLVIHNAKEGAVITVDGSPVEAAYSGTDAIIPTQYLKDVCQVRIIAEENGGYVTAAVWYNKDYGNELNFADDYGDYVTSDANGLGEPAGKVVDVLTWAYYLGLQNCINDQTMDHMVYATESHMVSQAENVFSDANAKNYYDTSNFQAVCDPYSIQFKDGRVRYNAKFVTNYSNRTTGETGTGTSYRTIELVFEDGMWKINRMALLSEGDYAACHYADLG